MVLETSWWTRAGWIIVRDVLLIGEWHHEHERSHTHRRAPTDYDADQVLATAHHRMKEGEQLYCALSWSEHPPPVDYDEAYRRLVWTAHHWQHWLDGGIFPTIPGAPSCSAAR